MGGVGVCYLWLRTREDENGCMRCRREGCWILGLMAFFFVFFGFFSCNQRHRWWVWWFCSVRRRRVAYDGIVVSSDGEQLGKMMFMV